jgi:hypothetical protein
MTCQEAIDVMDDAIEDRLGAHLRTSFQEHMDECGACRTYLEQIQLTRQALRLQRPGSAVSLHRAALLDAFREEFDPGRD